MFEAGLNYFKTDRRSLQFTLFEHYDVKELFDHPYFSHMSMDEVTAIMDQCHRFCNEVLGPLNHSADRKGCVLENGQVRAPKGFKEAWVKLYELGIPNFAVSMEFGGFS